MFPQLCHVPAGTFGTEAVSAKTQHNTSNDAVTQRLSELIGSPGRKIEQNASTQPAHQFRLAPFGDKAGNREGGFFSAERLPYERTKRLHQKRKQGRNLHPLKPKRYSITSAVSCSFVNGTRYVSK